MPRPKPQTPPPIRTTRELPGTTPPPEQDPQPEARPRRKARRKKQPEIVCIFGRRGSGKSYLAKQLIQTRERVVVFDTLGEYPVERTFRHLVDLYRFLRAQKALPGGGRYRVAFLPDDPERDFSWTCRIVEEIGELTLVAEEVDFFVSPNKLDLYFGRLIRYGRHRGIELIAISRRPAEVNRNLTAQASRLFVFRMHEPRDLAYFRSIIGPKADEIPHLPDYTPLEHSS